MPYTAFKKHETAADSLKDRVILVTGAGQGLGRSAALAFAQQGATVILAGRKQNKLEAVYDEMLATGLPEPLIFPLDLEKATEDDYKAMAEGIYQQLGRLDGILHNAAHFGRLGPLDINTSKEFERMFKVNVIAPFALTKACLPLLKMSEDASVVFVSSSAGHEAAAYWGAHGVSKKALEHLMQTWSLELQQFPQIRLNAVIPGAIQSPQRKKSHPGEVHAELPTADSLMEYYVYLMGPDSRNERGQVFGQ
ncbi:MAG: YciK family oxidoreductase [Betaproteobacteria bacterium HGW-Betaproteobacteria-1]|jgi:NAD(P)-dependent dehydrogenase (short-subunit alcohol dehydrogenase family)|nr:MAG: YciK family oxidoreductase [Betaproteobacteria bacterium HGW-Betaproteobacteria-1]